jgi:hypothetical protein
MDVAGRLIDAAAALIAEQAAGIGASDPDWTAYVDGLATRSIGASPSARE